MIAGGVLFPEVQDAEAQGIHSGYTYTQRVCQYGPPPRWYQVQNEMAGSDWRSDGGWTMVLERGIGTPAYYSWHLRIGVLGIGGATNYATLPAVQYRYPVAVTGDWTVYPLVADDPSSAIISTIDQNRDGVIDASDHTGTQGRYFIGPLLYHPAAGGVYVRWANLAWRW